MDLILAALGFLLLTFAAAVIKNDAIPWTISFSRALVRAGVRLQPEGEREITGTAAEFEALAEEVNGGRRATTAAIRFAAAHLGRQVVRRPLRRSRRPFAPVLWWSFAAPLLGFSGLYALTARPVYLLGLGVTQVMNLLMMIYWRARQRSAPPGG